MNTSMQIMLKNMQILFKSTTLYIQLFHPAELCIFILTSTQ